MGYTVVVVVVVVSGTIDHLVFIFYFYFFPSSFPYGLRRSRDRYQKRFERVCGVRRTRARTTIIIIINTNDLKH
jgi:hypothetical protein